jgi:hypothetical protein
MKTLRIALAAAAAAALAMLGIAAPAQAYPVQGLFIGSNFSCCGDFDISVQVTSSPSGVVCTKLVVSATNGAKVIKGGSRAASQTFTNVKTPFTVKFAVNPNDDDTWKSTTHATCTYDDSTVPQTLSGTGDTGSQSLLAGGVGRFSTSLSSAIQTISASGTLSTANCPGGSDDSDSDDSDSDDSDSDDSDSDDSDNGGLPDTGGERLLWLLIGLLLVAGGSTVIISSRREGGAES